MIWSLRRISLNGAVWQTHWHHRVEEMSGRKGLKGNIREANRRMNALMEEECGSLIQQEGMSSSMMEDVFFLVPSPLESRKKKE